MQTFREGGNGREGKHLDDDGFWRLHKATLPLEFCAEKREQINFLFYKNEAENTITNDATIIINVAPILLALSNHINMDGERAQR